MKYSEYIEEGLKLKLNKDTANLIDKKCFIINLKKGQTVIHEGDKSLSLYFIIKGIVRGYYIDDKGEDITKCFSIKNQFCKTEGLRTEKASSFTIECLEDSSFIEMPYDLIAEAMDCDEKLKKKVNDIFLHEVSNLEYRLKDLILLNAEERYNDFCRMYPEILEKVELKYIASFIGIRPASLSRIRKNIKINH